MTLKGVTPAEKLRLAQEAGVTLPHYTNTENPVDFPKSTVNMNERIKELQIQAEAAADEIFDRQGKMYGEIVMEKFAELIVREYEKLLPEICPWADADKEGPMKGWHVQFVARKHFGVEE
jgi:hypothetical protein